MKRETGTKSKRPALKIALGALVIALAGLLWSNQAGAARLKDITNISGVRPNQLIGYGLVVGLKNTGDKSYKSPFTIQTLLSMLERLGTTVDVQQLTSQLSQYQLGTPDARRLKDIRVENVAAVMVTSTLPAFAKNGSKIDVTVSSLGDARSLAGGTLLLTPLKAPNGEVYAVAQGSITVGDVYDSTAGRRRDAKGHVTVAKIADGAIVENEVVFDFSKQKDITLTLNNPDFTTNSRIVKAINGKVGTDVATSADSGTVNVAIPQEYDGKQVEFVAQLESIEIQSDSVARVVLDERTGTIVVGENVKLAKVAVSHGPMSITIADTAGNSGSQAEFGVIPGGRKGAKATSGKQFLVLESGATINDLVSALNAIGTTPRDLVSIFQSLKSAGALDAELQII